MTYTRSIPQNLFLFNTQHAALIRGESQQIPSAMNRRKAIAHFGALFLTIALPISLLLSAIVALTGRNIGLLLTVELSTSLFFCIFVVLMSLRHDRKLKQDGQIIIGEIVNADTRLRFGRVGSSTITYLRYQFQTPESNLITKSIELHHTQGRLPDGRKYPAVGAKIAVLYSDPRHLMLL